MINKLTYIVDDDKLTTKLSTMLLSRTHFSEEIISFLNPQLALDTLLRNSNETSKLPDVILLDLNMLVLDGWQFLDEFLLLPIQKKIAIFIVTSSIDATDIAMVKKYSIVKDYIMKPLTNEKIRGVSDIIQQMN
jgi:CheY-like chemotaxis protein